MEYLHKSVFNQIDQPSLDKILRIIEESKNQGAKIETGGNRIGDKGFFVEPTVLSGVTDQMSCAVNEVSIRTVVALNLRIINLVSQIFGPVQTILKFDNLEEVIERANNTVYGLAAGVLTNDINTALVCANAFEAGSVW